MDTFLNQGYQSFNSVVLDATEPFPSCKPKNIARSLSSPPEKPISNAGLYKGNFGLDEK
jgi:hypothetical protein